MKAPTPDAIAAECTDIVREAVIAARGALGDLKGAVPDVGRRYGLSERRVQSYWWSRVTFVSAHEHAGIHAARDRDLAVRELRLSHSLAMTRAALNAQRTEDARDPAREIAGMAGVAGPRGLRGWRSARQADHREGGCAQGTLNLGACFAWGRR